MGNTEKIDIMEISNAIETVQTRIDESRSVLQEVLEYFELTSNHPDLPRVAGHILNLLNVTDGILYASTPELDKALSGCVELVKAERQKAG